MKFGIILFLLSVMIPSYALNTQTSVFLPFNQYFPDQELKFSIRIKNPSYRLNLLEFNTNCHMRFRIYKDQQLVFPSNLAGTCFGFPSNKILLEPMQAVEHEFKVPLKDFSPGKYLIVSTVNNQDLLQVRGFEVSKRPVLESSVKETCGGPALIKCKDGLICNLKGKNENDFGYCEISSVYSFKENGKTFLRSNKLEEIKPKINSKNFKKNESVFVKRSEFLNLISYLSPLQKYSTTSKELSITKEEGINILINSLYKDKLKPSLSGFYFVDTIFSDANKEIDLAYELGLIDDQGIYFYPKSLLKWSDLNKWIKNLK